MSQGWANGLDRFGEERRKKTAIAAGAGLAIALVCGAALGQTAYSGRGSSSGQASSGVAGLAPLTYGARTDTCELGTETGPLGCAYNATTCPSCTGPATAVPMAFNGSALPGVPGASGLPVPGPAGSTSCGTQPATNQYLCGLNTTVTDPDFHTQMVRATDYSMAGEGLSFNLGSDGNLRRWASDSSKLLVNNTGSASAMLAFNPANWGSGPVGVSRLAGGSVLGSGALAFSRVNPHILYELNNDQENTVIGSVTSGTCVTPETVTQASTSATAKLQAVNPTVLMQLGKVTGTADGTHIWTGGTSGCVFTPASPYLVPATGSATPYANTLYKGVINDATQADPTQWTITYSLLFNFNYVAGAVGTAAAAYFPTSSSSCVPANFNASWNGTFIGADDDSRLGVSLGDNGQSNGWNNSLGVQGPIYLANYTVGSGCRVLNTHTDQISGDWGPTGPALDGQHNYITGTITGSPAVGAILTQATTGATTQFMGPGSLVTGLTAPSGYTYNRFVFGSAAPAAWEVGLIDGTADSTHTWSDGTGSSLVPSAAPASVPFYYPGPMHDSSQTSDPANESISLAQMGNGKISGIYGNCSAVSGGACTVATAGQTTITFTAAVSFPPDRQVVFYNTTGSASYLGCAALNQWCPVFDVICGSATSGAACATATSPLSSLSLVIADTANPNGSYAVTYSSGYPLMYSSGNAFSNGYQFVPNPNYWQVASVTVNSCISPSCQGHGAEGYMGAGHGSVYTWHVSSNPSLPCTVTGYTPCPRADEFPLLSATLPGDQHGAYGNHGRYDLTPMALSLTNVCGQASSGTNGQACVAYTSPWSSEYIAVENSVTNNASGLCGTSAGPGCHCDYGSGPVACTYRFNHSFNSNDSWDFNAQNAIGNISPDGQWFAFPSTWMNTLGCMNGATACWGSYVASGPATASMAGATIQTNGSGVITVTMSNEFCAPNGNQYYWTGSAVETIACGALAEPVTLSGFAESWANQTITLTAAGGCDATDANAGKCTSFSGTGTGVPASYGPVTESSGTQKAVPVSCLGGGGANTYCQRSDVWIAKLGSAH